MKDKDPVKVLQGKRNRKKGARFELKVRKDLESKKWIVDKWTNNVEDNKLIRAKSFMGRTRSNGFPDFICFKTDSIYHELYKVIGVEVKTNGKLSRIEKEKCRWYLKNKIFSKIFIASKNDKGISYEEFK